MIWFTSDNHWFHKNILEYSGRPFQTLEEMHETMIKRWNERVKPEDTIYVLEDLNFGSFKDFEPIAKRLQGRKVLIKGNHDHLSITQYNKLGFEVFYEAVIKIGGKMVRLSHYPYKLGWFKSLFAHKSQLRFLDRRPPKIEGEWLLHGHSHVKYKRARNENRIHVGVDSNSFYPLSANEIESLMNKND